MQRTWFLERKDSSEAERCSAKGHTFPYALVANMMHSTYRVPSKASSEGTTMIIMESWKRYTVVSSKCFNFVRLAEIWKLGQDFRPVDPRKNIGSTGMTLATGGRWPSSVIPCSSLRTCHIPSLRKKNTLNLDFLNISGRLRREHETEQ